jgi:hypothetical protein
MVLNQTKWLLSYLCTYCYAAAYCCTYRYRMRRTAN